jgi:cytochrome oxidase assembly protein ShyY1
MSRYRFALRPKWILSHLFVLTLVVAMILACRWQIHRLHEKQDRNARITARTSLPVEPVGSLLGAGDPTSKVKGLEYRRVTATGTYRADQEVIVQSRSNGGAPGSWILTPLDLGDGTAVVVNRGWFANPGSITSVPASLKAPGGTVTVTGRLRVSETRGSYGPKDPVTGTLTALARADVARIDQQVPEDLLPGWIQLSSQRPKLAASAPEPVPPEPLDEGPHFSYAVQWAIFTTIALVGYPLILRKRARELEREGDDEDPAAA